MKSSRISKKALWILLFLSSVSMVKAQKECQVLMPEISGSYTGKCKKGLAHGKGVAVGTDTYEGRFLKGLPNGKGIYTWADGRIYEGEWVEGIREGEGTMIYPTAGQDSVVTGIWKDDTYYGPVPLPSYKVTRVQSVSRHTIRKSNDMGTGFRLAVYLAGNFNTDLEDFSIASTSGQEYSTGRYIGIQNAVLPYSVIIRYRTWNQMHSERYDVIFEFTINEPGSFEVSLHH
jgi:hypothetical protein